MHEYITEKYAGMLNEEDVTIIFNILAKELGENRSEAARQCGLTGKTTYDWDGAKYVKLETKKKVLQASLKKNFLSTLEYLFTRSNERNEDLLRTILSTLYADALEAASREKFVDTLAKFKALQIGNQGKINDGLRDEVTDMVSLLREKAVELAVPLGLKTIHEMLPEEIVDVIPAVGQLYAENPTEAELFAERDLDLPAELLKPLMQTFRNLCSTKRTQASAMTVATAIQSLLIEQNHVFSIGASGITQRAGISQKQEENYATSTTA